MKRKARFIALYLPQYHPVEVNNKYWGEGFTEWTNVTRAKPLFKGHYQPRLPANLGFYDLRIPEVREAQAKMASESGIEGFCYWHYWFGNGQEVLERPFDEVVESGKPDFPFCLGWALHDWSTKTWVKDSKEKKDVMIFKQEFPGEEDEKNHFYRLLPAFRDPRYLKVDGKLLFVVLCPNMLPNATSFMKHWNKLAKENDLSGFHFVASIDVLENIRYENFKNLDSLIEFNINKYRNMGFDAIQSINGKYAEIQCKGKISKVINSLIRRFAPGLYIDKFDYSNIMKYALTKCDSREDVYPQIYAGWDRSPRAGRKAVIYNNDTPLEFGKLLDRALEKIKDKPSERKIIFINSWTEWGEGAYLEPDLKFGTGKLNEIKKRVYR